MKTIEIDFQTEKVLNLIANGVPLNLMERMEISMIVEELRNTPREDGRPEWRSAHVDVMGK